MTRPFRELVELLRNVFSGGYVKFRQSNRMKFEIDGPLPRIAVGRHSYGKVKILSWNPNGVLKIGDYTSIGGLTVLLGGGHHRDVSTYPFRGAFRKLKKEKASASAVGVDIGNDVWIGYDVCIKDGVKIGNGAILGFKSVVTKDVPPYCIFAGNPARQIGSRFSEPEIVLLESSRWWELPENVISKNIDLFYSNDIDSFLKFVESAKKGSDSNSARYYQTIDVSSNHKQSEK